MSPKAAITVDRPPEEVQRLWQSRAGRTGAIDDVTFSAAPGDRGTEIHVTLDEGNVLERLTGGGTLAKVKAELRRFKQHVENGEKARVS
jgi:uncharacterized membrane protein